jgi:Fe-S-cluster containining protein
MDRRYQLFCSLRFECQRGCTRCCEQEGFIYLTESDVVRMAEFLGLSQSDFERRFVYRTTKFIRLKSAKAAPCHFLNANGCSIHAVKPLQCRAFPLWPELLASEQEWSQTASWCPGIGKGDLINIEVAQRVTEEVRGAFPDYYGK